VTNSSNSPFGDVDIIGFNGTEDETPNVPISAQDAAADHVCEPYQQVEGLVFFSCRQPRCNRVWRLDRPSGEWCLAN
jgi:hypothetical protein